jgi:hypothetical protein
MGDNMQNINDDLVKGVSDNPVGNMADTPATNPVTNPANSQQVSNTTGGSSPVSSTESMVIEKEASEVDQGKKSIKIDEDFKADVDTSTTTIEDTEEDSESYMDDTGDY